MTAARYVRRRADVQKQRALLGGLTGDELGEQRKCLRWSQTDEALELALDADAARLAREQANAGDAQAVEAVQRADQLDPAVVSEVRAIEATPRESPQPVGPDDPALLREIRAALAEHRDRGWAFDRAWAATAGALVPDKRALGVWRVALQSTRGAWERAYEGDSDQAAEQLAGLLEGLDPTDDRSPQTMAAA